MHNSIAEQMEHVRAGRCTFDVMARNTRREWEQLAAKLLRRFELPSAVTLEDVVQEMLMAAWAALVKFNPLAGPTVGTHALYHAHSAAVRWCNKQRGVVVGKRYSNAQPSRHAINEATMRSESKHLNEHAVLGSREGGSTPYERAQRPTHSYVDEVLDLMRTAHAQHEREVLRGLLCDVPPEELARQVFGVPDARRVEVTALVCLSRRSA